MRIKKLNYQPKKFTNYANRGKAFEEYINMANDTYRLRGMAYVEKAEPPVKVKAKNKNMITQGWFMKKGFVDYFGISHGRALAFEAKSTKIRTSFPLANIDQEQMEVLKHWHDQGGIAFFLIQFEKHHEVYILTYKQALEWWVHMLNGGRKSIPYDWFVMNCEMVKSGRGVALDYLACI
jgi:recombination protein U